MKHKQDDDGVSCHIIVKAGGVMFSFVPLFVLFVCEKFKSRMRKRMSTKRGRHGQGM